MVKIVKLVNITVLSVRPLGENCENIGWNYGIILSSPCWLKGVNKANFVVPVIQGRGYGTHGNVNLFRLLLWFQWNF